MSKNLCIGQRLVIGSKKADQFEMVVMSFDDKTVRGPHIGGVGTVEVPRDDIHKAFAGDTTTAALLKKAAEPVVVRPAAPKPVVPKLKRVMVGESKFDKAVTLAKMNPKLSRGDFIALLVKELGMTPAGASTYASTARKAAGK